MPDIIDKISKKVVNTFDRWGQNAANNSSEFGEKVGEKASKLGDKLGEKLLDKWVNDESKRAHIPAHVVKAVFERDKNKCKACGKRGEEKCPHCHQPVGPLQLDHKVPIAIKEPKDICNLSHYQTLCRHHNLIKSDRYPCPLEKLGESDCCK